MKRTTLATATSPKLKKASSGDRTPSDNVQIVNLVQSKSTNYYASLARAFKAGGSAMGSTAGGQASNGPQLTAVGSKLNNKNKANKSRQQPLREERSHPTAINHNASLKHRLTTTASLKDKVSSGKHLASRSNKESLLLKK